MTSFLRSDRSAPVAIWLFAVAALVFAVAVVGGATRLTGSGLSITEWKPISGALPPLSDQAWHALFAAYRKIPQFSGVNPTMTLGGFKTIFWWEWAHRLLARTVGAAFAIPFAYFLIRRQLPRRLIWRCAVLLVLGGLQGVVGWVMVMSGLKPGNLYVDAVKLTAHLGLALALFVALFWTALEAWSGQARQQSLTRWRVGTLVFLGAVYFQALLGALVAGNHAGEVLRDWPFFAGRLLPSYYSEGGLLRTLFHNQGSVQLHHRLMAYGLFIAALVMAVLAARSRYIAPQSKVLAYGVAAAVTIQAGLGIATLMTGVPVWLGALHQAGALLVLAVATTFAWRVRRL
jgi:cytochrome c oxidase assembly protein subunit 15